MKYASLVLLGLFVAVLAGCGGGGDGGKNDMIAMLEEDLALVQADLDAAQSELATTKDTLATTEDTLSTTESDLATTQAELATTKATLTTTQDTLATTQEDLAEANDDLEDKEAELATTQTELTTAESERDTAEEQLTTTRINLATATANLTNAQTNLMTARADLATAEAALEDKITELGTSQGDLTTARADLATVRTDLVTARADLKTAQDDLTAETAKLTMAQTELKTANDNLDSVRNTLQTVRNELLTARTRANTLQTQVNTLTAQVATLTGQVNQAQQGQQEAQQQAQSLEANQRAENLREAFQGSDGTTIASPLGTSPVDIEVPARNRLTFEQGDRRVSTISASGLRGARLTRTRGGTDTTVIYTDRELSRVLLDHYLAAKDPEEPRFNAVTSGNVTLTTTNFLDDPAVSISHGLRTSLGATQQTLDGNIVTTGGVTTSRALTTDRAFFIGSVHGVAGRFQCGGTDCDITVTGTYHDNVDDATTADENRLDTISITTAPGNLYFRPNSATATVSLCEDGALCTAGDDAEYIVFGWWREEPANVLADYDFEVFADVIGADAVNSRVTGEAEYDGTAAGMYVEQGALGSSGVTARQGEFTADVRLDVDFDGGTDVDEIQGTIDSFSTRPTGGSTAPTTSDTWVVKLTADTAAATGSGTAEIDIRGTDSTGAWTYVFAGNHATAPTSGEAQLHPSAMTGTFNARIPNLLHLVGAFGAHLQ